MGNLVYLPFNNKNGEKLQIKNIKIVSSKSEPVYMLVHELTKELDDGSLLTYFKATKLFRLTRVSKQDSKNKGMLEEHSDIIRALYSKGINYVQIIANILETDNKEALGLLFYYGAQEIASSELEAIHKCEKSYESLLRTFQATHRTCHIENPTYEEIHWIFAKLKNQKYVTAVKGIPAVKNTAGKSNNPYISINNTSEQLEQFLTGLETKEYLLLLMCTPITQKSLRSWLDNSLKEATKWESQKQGSMSYNFSIGVPMSMSLGRGTSSGQSSNVGHSTNESMGSNWSEGTSTGTSHSTGVSTNDGTSESFGSSSGTSSSTSQGTSSSTSTGSSESTSHSESSGSSNSGGANLGIQALGIGGNYSHSENSSTSDGTSFGTSHSESSGSSQSTSTGTSTGTSQSSGSSHSEGTSESWGESSGTSSSQGGSTSSGKGSSWGEGVSQGTSQSWGQNMGLAPSFGISKSYQWIDKEVEYICELLNFQNGRLKSMTEGEGGFYVDCYISTNDATTKSAIDTLVATTWINPNSKIDVLHTLDLDRVEQAKLALHMIAFSPCLEMATTPSGNRYYKYASILESSELSAYSNPPRITLGGIENSMYDIPCFRVPVNRQNKEIYIGHVMNGESYNIDQARKYGDGYVTDYKYCIGTDELHHAIFNGQSGSGKTVLVSRAVCGLYNNSFTTDNLTGEKKRHRILILDPKGEWRMMGQVVPKGKFRFYSINDPYFHPLRMNVLRVPKYIRASDYYNMIVEMFTSAYGLLDRAVAQIGSIIYDLYDKAGAFDNDYDITWAHERTKDITLEDVCKKLEEQKEISLQKRDNHNVEALTTYLTRLDAYRKPKSKEYIMFCNRGGMSCDEVLGKDDVTVIESNGLNKSAQSFFFTLLISSIFKYAQGLGSKGFYGKSDQYETFIVLEEANTVLVGAGDKDSSAQLGIKRFSEVLDQGRSYGLFIWTITQTVSQMPISVLANSGLIFGGQSKNDKDMTAIIKALGRDPVRMDINITRFMPKMPVGVFICKISKGQSALEQEPVLVKVDPLKIEIPDNDELDVIIAENDLKRDTPNDL